MAAEIVNLRQYRKEKQRQERERTAEQNRVRFGRDKAQRREDETDRRRSEQDLDGKQIDGLTAIRPPPTNLVVVGFFRFQKPVQVHDHVLHVGVVHMGL